MAGLKFGCDDVAEGRGEAEVAEERGGEVASGGGGAFPGRLIHPLCSKNSNSRAVLFTSVN